MKIQTPTSLGELYDKLTILEIKGFNIKDEKKLVNVIAELDKLKAVADEHPISDGLYHELKKINEDLWKIEDDIRECERQKDFGDKFIELARSVYFTNDKRSEVKKTINVEYGSDIVEEKSYEKY